MQSGGTVDLDESHFYKGEERTVHTLKTPVLDDRGNIIGILGIFWDITGRKAEEKQREALIAELKNALGQVRRLSGMLPICASCKKIRDDKGYWSQIEKYISAHTEAQFCTWALSRLRTKGIQRTGELEQERFITRFPA